MDTLYSISFIGTSIGSLVWGMIGIGGFLGKNLNVISFISRGNVTVEYGIYILIGTCSIVYIWLSSKR